MASSPSDKSRAGSRSSSTPVASQPPASEDAAQEGEPFGGFPSRQMGEFRILRLLGRGGMSEVYLAEQTSLHRRVAIKVLRPELLSDATIVKRFEQEAKAAAGLIHPNIVQIFAFGCQEGMHYIAQEYVAGMNLRELLNRKGPPEVLIAYHIIRQVAAALTAAGDAGIVHRDIKPENILITRKGEAKVVDFGLAQLAESEQRMHLTQVGMTMGTPLYMSPEQINGHPVDHRSDIYSFGVTCYRMLSGRPPFHGETTITLAMQHLTKTPEPLRGLRDDLPKPLCEIVHKMMARAPEDRYQHAREITQDLKRLAKILKGDPEVAAARLGAASSNAPKPTNWREAFFQWSPARHAITLAIAAVLVGGASAALGWWMRPRNPLETRAIVQDRIPKLATAKDQFEQADKLHSGDEDAWRAVIELFPDDRTYTPEARVRLAILDLKARRLDEAGKLFDELESMGSENANARTVGIAGKAVIASLRGQYKESQRLIVYGLGELTSHRDQIPADLWNLLREASRANVRRGEEASKQVKELFEDEP